MNSIEKTQKELHIAVNALSLYLDNCGRDEDIIDTMVANINYFKTLYKYQVAANKGVEAIINVY